MLQFEKRIETLKQRVNSTWYGNIELLNELVILIDELHAAYQAAWVAECTTTAAMEILREQIAALTTHAPQDSFDIDPNNKD